MPGGILQAFKVTLLVRSRIVHGEDLFAELVVWLVPAPLPGSEHAYKYRLALVAHGECVLRYDNEAAMGGHRQMHDRQSPYRFTTLDKLFADFERDIRRYKDEDRDA